MPHYGYLDYQAGRAMTRAEHLTADAQLGQHYAALAQLLRSLARPLRAARRHSGPSPSARPACWPADCGS
ncbi:MAG TPA: hypothetical protein VIJ82_07880 [Streptosporangiaceae bacterium]|jgi:hypothetical protein